MLNKKFKTGLLIAVTLSTYAQQNQTGPPISPNTPPFILPIRNTVENAWYRGGNFQGGDGGNKNIFGTMWNSPIYTVTDGITRTRLNGTLTTPINGVNQNVDGYFGIGRNNFFNNNSPWSMLHLEGDNNTFFLFGQWRKWMNTGLFMRENSDAMYVGMKSEAGSNRSDATVCWSDDKNAGGVDALRFIFIATNTGNGGGIANKRDASGLNGYEYMRMLPYPYTPKSLNSASTPIGHVGVGPLFDNSAGNSPKSRIHSHTEDWFENYFQWSNELSTGMAYNDGFKIGIGGYDGYALRSGHAYIYNQENRSILFSTNHEAPSEVQNSGTDAQHTRERMRISSISAPTNLNNNSNAQFGVWNPGGVPNQDLTRVSISHDPVNPVTRPLALLHLGYNTGGILFQTSTDGWRKWMDVGTFVSHGTDNMYIGLKPEGNAASFNDRQDAVISWGDNYTNTNPVTTIAPDKLRIIFTSPVAGANTAGPGAMSSQNGLEFARFVPFHNTALAVNDPRIGFGAFENLTPVGTINPGNTVEINSILPSYNAQNGSVTGSYIGSTGASGLRFRDLTSKSLAIPDSIADLSSIDRKKVLSVDSLGNVVLINASAGNAIGNLCGATTQNPLPNNWEIPTAGFNYNFSGNGAINITEPTLCTSVQSKLHVSTNVFNSAISGINTTNITGRTASFFKGSDIHKVFAIVVPTGGGSIGFGTTPNPTYRLDVNGTTNFNGNITGSGINSYVSDSQFKTNIDTITNALSIIKQLKPKTYYFDTTNVYGFNFDNRKQFGFIAQEIEPLLPSLVKDNIKIAVQDSAGTVINPAVNYKSLNYNALFAILVKGLQEQQNKIDSLTTKLNSKDSIQDARLTALENAIASCCSSNTTKTANNSTQTSLNQMDIELSDKDVIVLNQNVPNPFAEQTTITYNVPSSVSKAQIIFFNNLGQVIQTVDIKTRGKGKINVFASDLSSGLYNYSLVADGKVIDNKKMMRE